MPKPGANIFFGYLLLAVVIFTALAGKPQEVWAAGQSSPANDAGTVAAGESLDELKEKMEKVENDYDIRAVVDGFNALPGPDASAAQVLLDYLRNKNIIDAWNFVDALVKLMTDGQVSQLAKNISSYNSAYSSRCLVSVLAIRISNQKDLASAVISLQNSFISEDYQYQYKYLLEQNWQKIFVNSEDVAPWLDETYIKLSNPQARRSFVETIGVIAGEKLKGPARAAVTGWLWRAQEKEQDPVYRCNQLLTLYRLGETKALEIFHGLYPGLASVKDRAGLINRIGGIARWQLKEADRNDLVTWLWKIAEADASPYCRQESLSTLYTDLVQEKALEQFVRDTDQNGMATLTEEGHVFQIGGDWRLLRDVCQKYPQSYLSRGIKAYEEVRGEPYFEIDRAEEVFNPVWTPPYGDEQYAPDREIPGWENFLVEFFRHPAADDAAYRLARCYEIKGRFADAIKTMQEARFAPDGDMRYAADGRLVYILDVRANYEQMKSLSAEKLEPPLEAFVDYSLAVKEIRRDDFQQAAVRLEEFLKQDKILPAGEYGLPFSLYNNNDKYDLRGAVEKQLVEVKKIACLKSQWEESKVPADLYNLAAAIFHNEMLYYNHLWAGERQLYNWYGYINATEHGHAPSEMTTFVQELINCNHSLPYFQQVYRDQSTAPELRAKALYSTGLCYIGLDEWGEDASFAFNLPEIRRKVISTYQQFVKEYPGSSMADDALLALGAYTGDAAYLQKIYDEYPDSDVMGKVKKLAIDIESPYYRPVSRYVPFKVMFRDDESVPHEIKEWAAANIARPFTGSKTLGGWSYLLIAAGEKRTAGYSVGVISISGSSDKLKVYYRIGGPPPGQVEAQVITYPYVLVRVLANEAPVEFMEEARD